MHGPGKGALAVQPDLERLEAGDEGKGFEILLGSEAVRPAGYRPDRLEDARGMSPKDAVGQIDLLGSAGQADIDVDDERIPGGGDPLPGPTPLS